MTKVLQIEALDAGYGSTRVVHDLNVEVNEGEVIALLGPNGAGKTTTLSTIAGYLPPLAGRITMFGAPVAGVAPHVLARRGLGLVHDDRALFTSLTVRQNLELAFRRGKTPVDEVLELFPALARRESSKAQSLSGGEQQMLAVGRALVQRPRLLMVDEMSMGLAPIIVEGLLRHVRDFADRTGAAVVLVEQHVDLALRHADRVLVMVHGEVPLTSSAAELRADPELLRRLYLGDASPAGEVALSPLTGEIKSS
jgi:branched-chain amino acid transport system ATP-binding protein